MNLARVRSVAMHLSVLLAFAAMSSAGDFPLWSELGFVGASEMRSFEAANRQKIADLRTVQQRMVDHEVDAAVEQGRFHAEHPREAARAVVTMCTALPTCEANTTPILVTPSAIDGYSASVPCCVSGKLPPMALPLKSTR